MSLLVPTRTYARKGERVCCVQGHVICTVAKNIPVGTQFDRSYLDNWQQPEPKIGDPIPLCRICGSAWSHNNDRGLLLHFQDGGWRWAEAAF